MDPQYLYKDRQQYPPSLQIYALEPFPPKLPSSIYFLALSQAPPPAVIETATKSPVTITPNNIALEKIMLLQSTDLEDN